MNRKMLVAFSIFFFMGVACAVPAPKADAALLAPVAPVVAAAPAVVTATSSQVIARNYNGITAPLVAVPAIAAPVATPLTAPYIGAPYVAYPYAASAPYITYV